MQQEKKACVIGSLEFGQKFTVVSPTKIVREINGKMVSMDPGDDRWPPEDAVLVYDGFCKATEIKTGDEYKFDQSTLVEAFPNEDE